MSYPDKRTGVFYPDGWDARTLDDLAIKATKSFEAMQEQVWGNAHWPQQFSTDMARILLLEAEKVVDEKTRQIAVGSCYADGHRLMSAGVGIEIMHGKEPDPVAAQVLADALNYRFTMFNALNRVFYWANRGPVTEKEMDQRIDDLNMAQQIISHMKAMMQMWEPHGE